MPESHQSQLVEKRIGCEIATKKSKKKYKDNEKISKKIQANL